MTKKKPSSKRSTSRSIPRRTSRYARAEQSPINPNDPALKLIEEDMLRAEGSHTEYGLEIADADEALAEQRELGGLGPFVLAHTPGVESKLPPDFDIDREEPLTTWQLPEVTVRRGLERISDLREQYGFKGRRDPGVSRETELKHELLTSSDAAAKALRDLREREADWRSLEAHEPPREPYYQPPQPPDLPTDAQG